MCSLVRSQWGGAVTVQTAEQPEPGHPAEQFSFHGEFNTADGAQYLVGVLAEDGTVDTTEWTHSDMAGWLVERAGSGDHDMPEQLYQFPDEESMKSALRFLHAAAARRTDIRVMADSSRPNPQVFRRAVIYEMSDSVWMLEHIRPADEGRYLRLRSTGRHDLETYLGQLILPEESPK